MEWVLIISALATGGHPGAEDDYRVELTKLGFADFSVCIESKKIFVTANESIRVYGLEVNCEEARTS